MTAGSGPATPDAVRQSFVERLPTGWQPYARLARLDRPIGWWLLLLPCWWSAAIASRMAGQWPSLWVIAFLLVGAVVMRGAGSTWNDITDRDLDARVARTRGRPLPSGQVSVRQAFAFIALQAGIGLAILLQFNRFAVLMGMLSLLPVLVYPFMKRFTNHPQVVLGLAFAWGALMGFAIHLGAIPPAGWLLYLGGIAWVIGYDTVYALQDIEDDAIVGIGSTARAYGARVRVFIAAMFVLATGFLGSALVMSGAGYLAWIGLGGLVVNLVWQVATVELDNPERALMLFRSNRNAGLVFFAGLLLDAVFARL